MTRKKTEEYLVTLKPKPVFEPSIRKRSAAGGATATTTTTSR